MPRENALTRFRGECKGRAYSKWQNPKCVSQTENKWRAYNSDDDSWHDAGLSVRCVDTDRTAATATLKNDVRKLASLAAALPVAVKTGCKKLKDVFLKV